jgi:hypothetical protein
MKIDMRGGFNLALLFLIGLFGVNFAAAQGNAPNGDKPVASDLDGDGKTDLAVFRDGTWYLQRSTSGFAGLQFGSAGDLPIPSAHLS